MLRASSRYIEHFRDLIHLSAFQSGCVATPLTVEAKTCGYLYDTVGVGGPTGARMEVFGDSRESTVVVGLSAMPNFIPPMYWPPLSSVKMTVRSEALFPTIATRSLGKGLSTSRSLPRCG
jgi:hypothetical protein